MAQAARRVIVAFRATPMKAGSYRDLAESRGSTVSDLLRELLRKEIRRQVAGDARRTAVAGR